MASSPTLSLRLPNETRERLDRVAERSRRSRSYIIQRALELHLDDVAREEAPFRQAGFYSSLLKFAGAGARLNGGRSKEEIDADIRWLRGDD
jgi:predicted transcriptional regulator